MIARAWFGFWLWLAYATTVRRRWNTVLRWWLDRRAPSADIVWLSRPTDVAKRLAGWHWRRDGTRIGGLFVPLDYVSSPAVTEARLNSGEHADGDCDDAHHYAAVQLAQMPSVDAVYHVTIGYRGGGHLACVYRFRGSWWLMNYGRITAIDSPRDAAPELLRWARRPAGERPRWLVFEDVTLRRVRL